MNLLGLNLKLTVTLVPLRSLHLDLPHGVTSTLSWRLSNSCPVIKKYLLFTKKHESGCRTVVLD